MSINYVFQEKIMAQSKKRAENIASENGARDSASMITAYLET